MDAQNQNSVTPRVTLGGFIAGLLAFIGGVLALLNGLDKATNTPGFSWQKIQSGIAQLPSLPIWGWVIVGLFALSGLAVLSVIFSAIGSYALTYLQKWADKLLHFLHSHTIPFGYRRSYRRYAKAQADKLETEGYSAYVEYRTMQLREVYIENYVRHGKVTEGESASPFSRLKTVRGGRHGSIWEILSVDSCSRLVILGDAGIGKTSLAKHITSLLAGREYQGLPKYIHGKLPILLYIRHNAERILNENMNLPQLIVADIEQNSHTFIPLLDWFHKKLYGEKPCIVIFDGLDEVAKDEDRQQVVEWVNMQMEQYPHNHYIVTSRPGSYGKFDKHINADTLLFLRPFTDAQKRNFIHKFNEVVELRRHEGDIEKAAPVITEKTARLIKNIQTNSALLALAGNPLTLTLITTVFDSHYPDDFRLINRVALYDDVLMLFLGKRDRLRNVIRDIPFGAEHNIDVLKVLAFKMSLEQQLDTPENVVVKYIEDTLAMISSEPIDAKLYLQQIRRASGLLIPRLEGHYGFAHKTFQEYLTALYIKDYPDQHIVIKDNLGEPWWRETILMYMGMVSAERTSSLLEILLNQNTIETLAFALDCEEVARHILPGIRNQLKTILRDGVENSDPKINKRAYNIMLRRHLNNMQVITEGIQRAKTLVPQATYQLFLDDMSEKSMYFHPTHWVQKRFPQGTGEHYVVGMGWGAAQAFCSWLTANDTEGWGYRLPKSTELDRSLNISGQVWMANGTLWPENNEIITSVFDVLKQEFPEKTLKNIYDKNLLITRNVVEWMFLQQSLGHHSNRRNFIISLSVMDNIIVIFVKARELAKILMTLEARAHSSSFSIEHTFARKLEHISNRARALAYDLVDDLDQAQMENVITVLLNTRKLSSNMIRELFMIQSRIRNRDLLSKLDDAINQTRDLDTTLVKLINLLNTLDLSIYHSLFHDRYYDSQLRKVLNETIYRKDIRARVHNQARFLPSSLINQLLYYPTNSLLTQIPESAVKFTKHALHRSIQMAKYYSDLIENAIDQAEKNEFERLRDSAVREAAMYTLIKKRMDGELKPTEGILLVRERVDD